MAGYVKKVAVIKQVKSGFSADGGALSGLVKAETYAGFLKVEASLLNFAPLSEGRYVLGICDGLNTVTFESAAFEGECDFNLCDGFAFLVCFCKNGIFPVASAACGQMACALPDLKEEMRRRENFKPPKGGVAYTGEAVAEGNHYDTGKNDENGGALCAAEEQEKKGRLRGQNEENFSPFARDEKTGGIEKSAAEKTAGAAEERAAETDSGEENSAAETDRGGVAKHAEGIAENEAEKSASLKPAPERARNSCGETNARKKTYCRASQAKSGGKRAGAGGNKKAVKGGAKGADKVKPEAAAPRLAAGDYYGRMRGEIERIFTTYPEEAELERAIEGSRFARITYGENRFYVFGVLFVDGVPRYICYGVPAFGKTEPPPTLRECATYFPTQSGGYFITYQDAATGVSVKLSSL